MQVAIRCYNITFSIAFSRLLIAEILLKLALLLKWCWFISHLYPCYIHHLHRLTLQIQKYLNKHWLHAYILLYLIPFGFSSLSLSFVQRQTGQSYTNTHSSSSVKIKRNLFYKMKPLENYIHLNHIILIRCEIRSLRPNAEIADFQSYFHFLVALHRRLEQIFPFAK